MESLNLTPIRPKDWAIEQRGLMQFANQRGKYVISSSSGSRNTFVVKYRDMVKEVKGSSRSIEMADKVREE